MGNAMCTYRVITLSSATAWIAPVEPPPLPFFLDPEQIAELTPNVNWDRRVGDRIEAFREWAMRPVRMAA